MKKFTSFGEQYESIGAEVMEVIYKDDKVTQLYAIRAKPLDGRTVSIDSKTINIITARPINVHLTAMPIVGEVVKLYYAPSDKASGSGDSLEIYFDTIVNLTSKTNHAGLPKVGHTDAGGGNAAGYQTVAAGGTSPSGKAELDKNFQEDKKAEPLQPYVGDLLFQGRYGNAIRFSSTNTKGSYSKPQPWKEGTTGDPILVLRNSKGKGSGEKFIAEEFMKDDATITLTSTQDIKFSPSSQAQQALKNRKINKDFKGKQAYIISGRIVLNSFENEISLYSKNGVSLSSQTNVTIDSKQVTEINGSRINLGTNADQQIILGNLWKQWMENFIDAIGALTDLSPCGPCQPTKSDPQWGAIAALKAQLSTLLSTTNYVKKTNTT
jgi:hypothetical protein